MTEGALGRVAGVVQMGEWVELVARFDPDRAGSRAGGDGQLGGQGDLGAQGLPQHPCDLGVPCRPAVSRAREVQHPPPGPAREVLHDPHQQGVRGQRRLGIAGPRAQQLEAAPVENQQAGTGPRLDRAGEFGGCRGRGSGRHRAQMEVADDQNPTSERDVDGQ